MNTDKYTQLLPLSSYPLSLLKELNILSFADKKDNMPDDGINIVGSAGYRLQKFNADVDGMQYFKGITSLHDFVKLFERKLKKIVNEILEKKTHYMTDMKTGLDTRYNLDIGQISNGIYKINPMLIQQIFAMYNNGLFTLQEYLRITIVYQSSKTRQLEGKDYDIVYNTIRNRMILRWSSNEILQGYKQLPGQEYIKLSDALKMNTLTKIDMVVYYEGRFIEMTNIVLLMINVNGTFYPLDKSVPLTPQGLRESFDKNIRKDIEKLLYSSYHYSPFKCVKRLYSLARIRNDKQMLDKVIPFVSGNYSLIYQLKSEIDTDIVVLAYAKSVPIVSIDKHLDNVKFRLSKAVEINRNMLIMFNEYLDKALLSEDIDEKIEILESLNKEFKKIIFVASINFFNSNGLNPMITSYLPDKLTYNRRVLQPNYMPMNPIKAIDMYIGKLPEQEIHHLSKRQLKKVIIPTDDEILANIMNR